MNSPRNLGGPGLGPPDLSLSIAYATEPWEIMATLSPAIAALANQCGFFMGMALVSKEKGLMGDHDRYLELAQERRRWLREHAVVFRRWAQRTAPSVLRQRALEIPPPQP